MNKNIIRIPDDVWENRCQWCKHRNLLVKENRDVEDWEPLCTHRPTRESIPCNIMSITRYNFNKIPGECTSFTPNHIYGICWTCKWDNIFHQPSYCLFSDHPDKHPVYIGFSYGARYWKEHYLCTCENYSPDPSWIPWMLKEAADGRIPKNFNPETMEPIGETERNEVAEKWAEILADKERAEEEKHRKAREKEEIEEAARTGQLPGADEHGGSDLTRAIMKIGLHDSDRTGFPNYALMKISAWHKQQGDTVEWWNPMLKYDKVYSSKVFTFTPENQYLPPDTIKGGTGYGVYAALPDEIDDMFPDYSIYPDVHYAIGFLTRGCIRNCPWCVVPKKEGKIRPYRTWEDIKRPDSEDIVFMDNNVLACQYGIDQIRDISDRGGVRVDFNQGLDARLITPGIAELLGKLRWIQYVRMACDTDDMLSTVLDKIDLLNRQGIKPWRIFVYLLVKDVESAEKRAIALRDAGVNPFAQPYRDFQKNIPPTKEARDFARWVNQKAAFNSALTFREYNKSIRGHNADRMEGTDGQLPGQMSMADLI